MSKKLFIYVVFLWCGLSEAKSTVYKIISSQSVIVTQQEEKPFQEGEVVCILGSERKKAACGKVDLSKNRLARIKIAKTYSIVRKGFSVVRAKKKPPKPKLLEEPQPLPEMEEELIVKKDSSIQKPFLLGLGVNMGIDHLFSYLHFQWAIFPWGTVGVIPLFLTASEGTNSLMAFGGLASINVYPMVLYQKLVLHVSLGVNQYIAKRVGEEGQWAAPFGQAMAGWHFLLSQVVNVAVLGGVQYVGTPTKFPTDLGINYKDIELAVSVEIGLRF